MKLSKDVRAELRLFAFYLASRTLDAETLPGECDYSAIFSEPSALEQAFAIWSNTLDLDDTGKVTNAAHSCRRAAQYIRSYLDPAYTVSPAFQDWELELHM